MIVEAARDKDDDDHGTLERFDVKELLILSVATSIDALAVGITFAFLNAPIVYSAALIGVVTFIISLFGVVIGNRFGSGFKKHAETVEGAVLIMIGLKILLEHLGILL